MSFQKRSLKIEKLARIYDQEIAPIWGSRFTRMVLRDLVMPERGQVLDVSCGTGGLLIEVLRRLGEGSRVIAIEPSSAMLDVARKKVADLGALQQRGVFFRTESAVPRLSFADDVYDLVLCNLGVAEMPNLAAAVRDFARVTKPGGQVRCSIPMSGTFAEFNDIFREVLVKHDKNDALARFDQYLARYPSVDECRGWMAAAGLAGEVELERFSLLFRSSREFFFAPLIEYGPLTLWKKVAGTGAELQDVFWHVKEAIDAYFGDRAFEVSVIAGCLAGRKVGPAVVDPAAAGAALGESPNLADGSAVRTAELDLKEIEELSTPDPVTIEEIAVGPDDELEAFVDGARRPGHLDD